MEAGGKMPMFPQHGTAGIEQGNSDDMSEIINPPEQLLPPAKRRATQTSLFPNCSDQDMLNQKVEDSNVPKPRARQRKGKQGKDINPSDAQKENQHATEPTVTLVSGVAAEHRENQVDSKGRSSTELASIQGQNFQGLQEAQPADEGSTEVLEFSKLDSKTLEDNTPSSLGEPALTGSHPVPGVNQKQETLHDDYSVFAILENGQASRKFESLGDSTPCVDPEPTVSTPAASNKSRSILNEKKRKSDVITGIETNLRSEKKRRVLPNRSLVSAEAVSSPTGRESTEQESKQISLYPVATKESGGRLSEPLCVPAGSSYSQTQSSSGASESVANTQFSTAETLATQATSFQSVDKSLRIPTATSDSLMAMAEDQLLAEHEASVTEIERPVEVSQSSPQSKRTPLSAVAKVPNVFASLMTPRNPQGGMSVATTLAAKAWTPAAVDLHLVRLKGNDEVGGIGDLLSEFERQMTASEWVSKNAQTAERRLVHKGEMLVRIFEDEARRAIAAVEALETVLE